ncbi:hypothetical protein [Chitinibacter tainanensis]|uniref:hypothetical protein n=1 Tax=Chitinibacter tainanensis TaxID=230667 RepID=UPI0004910A36|nr:hypothetical protein [Chitinibacter tainanensis]
MTPFVSRIRFLSYRERNRTNWPRSLHIGIFLNLVYLPESLYRLVILNVAAGLLSFALAIQHREILGGAALLGYGIYRALLGIVTVTVFLPVLGLFGHLSLRN